VPITIKSYSFMSNTVGLLVLRWYLVLNPIKNCARMVNSKSGCCHIELASGVMSTPFCLRVRLGRFEVEVSGSRDEVLRTFEDLPKLVAVVSEAFGAVGIEAVKDASVGATKPAPSVYPSIESSGNCSDAVLRLLETDWGQGQPRTLPELVEAMRANAVHYPTTTLSGVLTWLVRKGKIKRWKTEKGYVYVLSGGGKES